MKLIFVAGAWGSGTTVVMGALDSLGVPTLGSHFLSNNSRILNTYELVPFRILILRYVDETTLERKIDFCDTFVPALEQLKLQLEDVLHSRNPDAANGLVALKNAIRLCLFARDIRRS